MPGYLCLIEVRATGYLCVVGACAQLITYVQLELVPSHLSVIGVCVRLLWFWLEYVPVTCLPLELMCPITVL